MDIFGIIIGDIHKFIDNCLIPLDPCSDRLIDQKMTLDDRNISGGEGVLGNLPTVLGDLRQREGKRAVNSTSPQSYIIFS